MLQTMITANLFRRNIVAFTPLLFVLLYWFIKTLNTALISCAQVFFFPDLDVFFLWKYGVGPASIGIHTMTGFTKFRIHKTIGVVQLSLFSITHLLMTCTVITTFGVHSLYTLCAVSVSWYLCLTCLYHMLQMIRCTSSIASNIKRSAIQESIRDNYMPLSVVCCIPAFIQQVYNEYSTHQ